jgi:Protein of unknown function (DUF3830)
LNRFKTPELPLRYLRAMEIQASETLPQRANVSLGRITFPAVFEVDRAPESCRALMRLLPYHGTVLHARWSGEAVWSPLRAAWPSGLTLRGENATGTPRPGQLLLYAGEHSEPEILVAYGETRFGATSGPLVGNPVLTIVDRLDELAHIGRSILERGADTLRVELVRGP